MNLDLISIKTVADTLLANYGKPVAESWSRYSIGRSIGWAVGWAIGTILFIIAVWLSIKFYKSMKKNDSFDSDEMLIFIVLCGYSVAWLIYVGCSVVNFSVAMYYPDAYWLIHDIKHAISEASYGR